MSLADDIARLTLAPEAKNVKILTIDIEWRPMQSYHWGLWDQNVGITQIVDDGGLLCFAAKWFGRKEIMFFSENDGHDFMVRQAHSLLSQADIVVTYNGDKYDVKKLNQEFMLAGMGPAKPFKSIDLVKTNRNRFDLPSRKLDYLVQRTGVGAKVKHQGFDLWIGCMNGDADAWKLMEKYNRGDVKVTEGAYVRLLPWITNAPHLAMFTGDTFACPHCGSRKLTRDGATSTLLQRYPLFQCGNCTGWSRGLERLQDPIRTRAVK